MAKRIDPLKAKQAKQKKIAIALGLLLVAVAALQGPKTLTMLKGPQVLPTATTSTPAAPAPTTTSPTPTGTAAPTGGLPAPAPVNQPAVLADSDLPPLATESQLLSFEQFQTKDPFAPQVDVSQGVGGAASGSTGEGAASGESSPSGASSSPSSGTSPDPVGSPQDQDPNADPPTFSVPGDGETDAPEPAGTTKISVNGVVESVETKASFPADEPVFQLVSLARNGKSVRIGVAGGSYATGEPTIALLLGKTLTLQNTADGSRYVLKLLAVEGFVPPKSTK